jgi:hypothetical protein
VCAAKFDILVENDAEFEETLPSFALRESLAHAGRVGPSAASVDI